VRKGLCGEHCRSDSGCESNSCNLGQHVCQIPCGPDQYFLVDECKCVDSCTPDNPCKAPEIFIDSRVCELTFKPLGTVCSLTHPNGLPIQGTCDGIGNCLINNLDCVNNPESCLELARADDKVKKLEACAKTLISKKTGRKCLYSSPSIENCAIQAAGYYKGDKIILCKGNTGNTIHNYKKILIHELVHAIYVCRDYSTDFPRNTIIPPATQFDQKKSGCFANLAQEAIANLCAGKSEIEILKDSLQSTSMFDIFCIKKPTPPVEKIPDSGLSIVPMEIPAVLVESDFFFSGPVENYPLEKAWWEQWWELNGEKGTSNPVCDRIESDCALGVAFFEDMAAENADQIAYA
jgi:hypothetical protein